MNYQLSTIKTEVYEINNRNVIVHRGDLRYGAPLPHHLKMGALEQVVINAKDHSYKMIGCFCTTHGIWQFGLPHLAKKYGMKSIVVFPSLKNEKTPNELLQMVDTVSGFELHQIRPNVVTVNQSQAKRIVEDQYGYFVPFGVDSLYAVNYLSTQMRFENIGTLIVPCGSGVTLAGVLKSIELHGSSVKNIIAISAGRPVKSILQTLSKHVDVPSETNIRWINDYVYNDIPKINCPWNAHPYYELKAYDWLCKNISILDQPIHFLNIGSL